MLDLVCPFLLFDLDSLEQLLFLCVPASSSRSHLRNTPTLVLE